MYSPATVDATHISVMVDYTVTGPSDPPAVNNLFFQAKGCSDKWFYFWSGIRPLAGSHTVSVVLATDGAMIMNPSDSPPPTMPAVTTCTNISVSIHKEPGFSWTIKGQLTLPFTSQWVH
jgi:hypothetical protein